MSTAAIIEPVQSSSVLLPGLRLRDSATIHTEEDLPEVHQASPNWLLALTDKTKIQQAVPPPSIAEEVSVSTSTIPDRSIYLINSPYTEPEHQLDLSTLDSQNQLLAQALAVLASATSSFATTPYQESLNWATVFSELKALVSSKGHNWTKQDFYVVEFRSKLKADIDKPLLFKLDKESHREATASGGLLKYWFGQPDAERRNLATCLWRSKEDAVAGGKGPWHKKARVVIPKMYESISVKGLRLTIEDNVQGWKLEPWA